MKRPITNLYLEKYIMKTFIMCMLIAYSISSFGQTDTLHYEIKLLPNSDRTDITVHLYFRSFSDSGVVFQFSKDYYGTPNLIKYVKELKADKGTTIDYDSSNYSRIQIKPGNDHLAHIYYKVSYDPVAMSDASYAPNTTANYFHAAFCQWMYTLPDHSISTSYHIKLLPLPKSWTYYSSQFNNTEYYLKGPFNELFKEVVGASSDGFTAFDIQGRSVRIFVNGKFDIGKSKIVTNVKKIFSAEHKWWNDFDFPFYTITIMPRKDNVAGLRVRNMFLCHVKEDATEARYQFNHFKINTF
jgi:predicted metalloprotease with PDZ domain